MRRPSISPRQRLWLLLVLVGLVLVPGTGALLHLAYAGLRRSFGLALDLGLIALLLVLIALFFAPLEALGWWAGWEGDQPLETGTPAGSLAAPVARDRPLSRFVVYLDGIGQASGDALPEGEDFLRRLALLLPDDIAILRGLMPYSVRNVPLTEGSWLAGFWRWVDRLRLRDPRALLGALINLRNVTVVAVSADQRYGPIYNQGMAQVIADSLLAHGYPLESGIPVTLLGFSGGGQIALGALPHLRRSLRAPIEVISLGGVFAGNTHILEAEHLYHLLGDRDPVARLGPLLFPRRWRWQVLSYWNRARRRGKVTIRSMGPVGHALPGGLMDAAFLLPDGRSAMDQTVDQVAAILLDRDPATAQPEQAPSNVDRFRANGWHHLDVGRDSAPPPAPGFRPLAGWIGRLRLPEPEQRDGGRVGFEVFAAPEPWRHLVSRTCQLEWQDPRLGAVVQDVNLSPEARWSAGQGLVHPLRLDHWRRVSPLESLAGSRPDDDVLVRLPEPVKVLEDGRLLRIEAEPVQTTGLALALVQFRQPLGGDLWSAASYEPQRGAFRDLADLRLRLPMPIANGEGILPATAEGIERSALNAEGWLVSGVPDGAGAFVVQSLVPRRLRRPLPDRVVTGRQAARRLLKRELWDALEPGTAFSALVSLQPLAAASLAAPAPGPALASAATPTLPSGWQLGERLLVVHVFGGIGGEQREQALQHGPCVGHFAYGIAEVVAEPLAGETAIQLAYRQVYAHNPDGLIAGRHDDWRYLGDRQWGWLGTRPVADILLRYPPFTGSYRIGDHSRSPLDGFDHQLTAMMARYRVGDGTGATFVGPANNCAQDSNQALFAAIRALQQEIAHQDPAALRAWEQADREQAERLRALLRLERRLRHQLLPFAGLRPDWQRNAAVLGSSLEDRPLDNLLRGLGSWRMLLPRLASETVVWTFLEAGASALILRSNQCGGEHPQIEPVAPITLPL
ncbi:hypothetical protein [Vulcanococcus limneticus]|uniref:hypothetical protein n=1 Tax=Vulcanococcus limneticus TaxID=2170428 RepID=UPI00398BE565